MAYTKTNLNETTETVAVDMTAEDVENNETTETVAEQNTRAYSKTVWNESTPITADKLNKIETGIANALDTTTGGTVNGNVKAPIFEASIDLVVNKHGFKSFYTNNQEGAHIFCNKNNSAITLEDNRMIYRNPHGNLEIGPRNGHYCHIYTDRTAFYFNKDLSVNGGKVYHEGNKPTAGDVGALALSGGTLSGNVVLNNDKALGGKDASGNVKWLAWVDKANSSNFGDTGSKSVINSSVNPEVKVGQNVYHLYHTGNKPTPADIGALPLTGGTLTGDLTCNTYLKLNAWPNYGTGTANLWYDANNKVIRVENATKLTLNGASVSTEGHTHNYLPLTGGTLSGAVVLDNSQGIGGKDTSGNVKWLAWVDKANKTQLGDGTLKSVINSSANPEVNISGVGVCTLYHTGNKPTAAEIGAAPASHTHNYLPLTGGTVSGETVFTNYLSVKAWPNYGTGTAQLWYDGNTKLLNIQYAEGLKAGSHRVATWEGSNPTHHMFRYGSGLGGANGYITFSY